MKIKLIVLIFLTLISYIVIVPRRENLAKNGYLNSDNKPVFSIKTPEFTSYLQSSGLPLVVKLDSYDLEITNLNENYDIIYNLTFSENDPIIPYLENVIGSSTPSIDGHPGFDIKPGGNYFIRNVPLNAPILNKFGQFTHCGFFTATNRCPEDLYEFTELTNDKLKIIASPNINNKSLIIQIILIIIFWVVVTNSLLEFFRRH